LNLLELPTLALRHGRFGGAKNLPEKCWPVEIFLAAGVEFR